MKIHLPVVRWGHGERTVLLVHGLTSSSRVWWRVASELADRGWQVDAVDLRGHGAAPPATRYSLADVGEDLVAVGSGWDVVVGHSFGGAAVVVAAHDPEWTGRVVLVDPVIVLSHDRRQPLLDDLLAGLEATPEQVASQNPGWHDDDVFWKVWSSRQCSPSMVRQVLADNDPWDVSDMVCTIPVPCTVLAGEPELGAMVEVDDIRSMIPENPRIRVERVEGTGHSIFRQSPEAVVRAVTEG